MRGQRRRTVQSASTTPGRSADSPATPSKPTRPVTHDELLRFVEAADRVGDASVGTAAMIAYYWLQRQVDILSRLAWTLYRPAGQPIAKICHHRPAPRSISRFSTTKMDRLYGPELMARLDTAPRLGTLIVTRDRPDRRRKTHLPWREDYFRHRVAAIRAAAGIDADVKFMGLRNGGNTEGADADLSDAQLRALSGHKNTGTVLRYARETMKQRQDGARKRRDARTKREDLSQ